ncbi:MAG: hypothetical protein LBN23_07280 [Paludibacter sp.]|jgi:hypothetical protein|nr:hypothetical protein [Paludibacter sp.]
MELIFILIGIILLILIITFKKKINNYYDNTKGLSESQAKFYKNFVVYLVPIIFILAGFILLVVSKLDETARQNIVNYIDNNALSMNFIGGILLILFGIITFILKFTKYKYKAFAKLATTEEKYGKTMGNIIHTLSYSIAPIAIGIFLILK